MACCGRRVSGSVRHWPPGEGRPAGRAEPRTVTFEYTGRTGLTVMGPVTGRQYRFRGAGATLPVDARDERSVAMVPHVRRVP
jgi:hypothetical protein